MSFSRLFNHGEMKGVGGNCRNGSTLFYWKTVAGESIADVFARPTAETALLDEPQGEAICFNLTATGVLWSSESRGGAAHSFLWKKVAGWLERRFL